MLAIPNKYSLQRDRLLVHLLTAVLQWWNWSDHDIAVVSVAQYRWPSHWASCSSRQLRTLWGTNLRISWRQLDLTSLSHLSSGEFFCLTIICLCSTDSQQSSCVFMINNPENPIRASYVYMRNVRALRCLAKSGRFVEKHIYSELSWSYLIHPYIHPCLFICMINAHVRPIDKNYYLYSRLDSRLEELLPSVSCLLKVGDKW